MDAVSLLIGVDIGGTTSTVALGESGRVLHVSEQFPTRAVDGPDATVAAIAETLRESISRLGLGATPSLSLGLATPGPATLDGVLSASPNLGNPAWEGCDIRGLLGRRLQDDYPSPRVRYIGDGQAAALGEYAIRSGKLRWDELSVTTDARLASLFMVAIGTGFGGGEVRDGNVVRGSQGRAGHAGHIMLPGDAFRYEHDRQLRVGNGDSTVESAVSLSALTHQLAYRLSLPQWRDHPLQGDPADIKEKAKRLRELAAGDDPLAIELFEDQAAALGIALLSLHYIGDYDLLVIGGGVCDLRASLRKRYLDVALESYQRRALQGFRGDVPVEFSVCGDHASVIGALAFAAEA